MREEEGFRIYKPPRRDGVYVLGNDNAEGVIGEIIQSLLFLIEVMEKKSVFGEGILP